VKANQVKKLAQSISEFPTLPAIVARVIQELNNPYSSAADITDIISADPAMTFRILKMANSAYYGFPRSITTVTESIVLLGFSIVRNLMLTTLMYQFNEMTLPAHFKKSGKRNFVAVDRQEEWRHSVATAIATREIILQRHQEAWEHLGYLAGLMHDIGKSFFCHYMPDEYREVMLHAVQDNQALAKWEEEIIGADHGQVGAWIVDRWNLPKEIVEPIACHHCPKKAKTDKELTAILHVGDLLARKIRKPEAMAADWNRAEPWLEYLNLSEPQIREIEALVAKELSQIETFMAVD
jgi:putative nucleotidyltransferase with HDIG domain